MDNTGHRIQYTGIRRKHNNILFSCWPNFAKLE